MERVLAKLAACCDSLLRTVCNSLLKAAWNSRQQPAAMRGAGAGPCMLHSVLLWKGCRARSGGVWGGVRRGGGKPAGRAREGRETGRGEKREAGSEWWACRCPYTPPHPLNLDFPHLVLRYRAAANAPVNRPAAAKMNPVTDGDPTRMGPAAGGMSMEGPALMLRRAECDSRLLLCSRTGGMSMQGATLYRVEGSQGPGPPPSRMAR